MLKSQTILFFPLGLGKLSCTVSSVNSANRCDTINKHQNSGCSPRYDDALLSATQTDLRNSSEQFSRTLAVWIYSNTLVTNSKTMIKKTNDFLKQHPARFPKKYSIKPGLQQGLHWLWRSPCCSTEKPPFALNHQSYFGTACLLDLCVCVCVCGSDIKFGAIKGL